MVPGHHGFKCTKSLKFFKIFKLKKTERIEGIELHDLINRSKMVEGLEAAKDVVDLEKAIDIIDAAAVVEAIAGEEKVPADLQVQVQRDASKLNNQHARKKYWLLLWFLIVVWVMILTDHFFDVDGDQQNDHAESDSPHSTLAKFIGFLSVICLMFRALD
uniref:Uncharacterized protein n=3 Tax=Oryza TaxID=4527 RepID=Q650S7_ORYSJ|nr:hypothetical protein [Oryza sativa Japonica Group]